MLRELEVRETLVFQGLLRNAASLSRKEVEGVVDSTCEVLGLGDVVHSTIGDEDHRGISGRYILRPVIHRRWRNITRSFPCQVGNEKELTLGSKWSQNREFCSSTNRRVDLMGNCICVSDEQEPC